ncbi:MAG TPA: hypothetical protein VF719_06975 [Abditibacteriaceae bacterium]|jgi:hypothetical protein
MTKTTARSRLKLAKRKEVLKSNKTGATAPNNPSSVGVVTESVATDAATHVATPVTEETTPEEAQKAALKEAARILKTKGTKKRERRKAAGVMGQIGGSKGGINRARNLTPEQRTEIARKGGLARQAKAREEKGSLTGSKVQPNSGCPAPEGRGRMLLSEAANPNS